MAVWMNKKDYFGNCFDEFIMQVGDRYIGFYWI